MTHGNPRCEVWEIGDRVIFGVRGPEFGLRGRVAVPSRDPDASETNCVWVEWEDGDRGYINPNSLDAA